MMYVCENALSIRRGAQRSDVSAYQLAYEAVPVSDSDHHLHGVQVLQRLCQRCRREVSVQLHTSYVYVCMYVLYVQYVKQAEFATCIYGSICLRVCTYIRSSSMYSMCIIVCLYVSVGNATTSATSRLTSHGVNRLVDLIHRCYYNSGGQYIQEQNSSTMSLTEVAMVAEKHIFTSGNFHSPSSSRDFIYS